MISRPVTLMMDKISTHTKQLNQNSLFLTKEFSYKALNDWYNSSGRDDRNTNKEMEVSTTVVRRYKKNSNLLSPLYGGGFELRQLHQVGQQSISVK